MKGLKRDIYNHWNSAEIKSNEKRIEKSIKMKYYNTEFVCSVLFAKINAKIAMKEVDVE